MGPTIAGAGGVAAVGYVLVPIATIIAPIVFLTAGIFVVTAGAINWGISQLTLRQSMTPAHIQGRMGATMRTISWGTLPFGYLVGGVLGEVVGVVSTIWIGSVGLLFAVLPILVGPIRHIRAFPVSPAPDASSVSNA